MILQFNINLQKTLLLMTMVTTTTSSTATTKQIGRKAHVIVLLPPFFFFFACYRVVNLIENEMVFLTGNTVLSRLTIQRQSDSILTPLFPTQTSYYCHYYVIFLSRWFEKCKCNLLCLLSIFYTVRNRRALDTNFVKDLYWY